MNQMPDPAVLRWVAAATGAVVDDAESLHTDPGRGSGTYRLRMRGSDGTSARDLVLKVPVPGWIDDKMVATNARALQVAASHGLAAPQLIAAHLDGQASGMVATLETLLSGSSALPPSVSVARLEQAGAAIAKIHGLAITPQDHLPYRPRPVAVDDFAGDRRQSQMSTTPLLERADEQTRAHGVPAGATVFVHGDVWPGNMLWNDDTCTALIDWKTAGVGAPGVDLSGLRLQMALHYGPDAPGHVLDGWQRQTSRHATSVPYWDAIAALNTPTELPGWPGFAEDGGRLDTAAVTQRRDEFLRAALAQLPT